MAKENEKGLHEEELSKDSLMQNDEKLSTTGLDDVSGGLAITESQIRHIQLERERERKYGKYR